MAQVSYRTFFPDIAPHVPGCPDPVMEFYIRKVCIDLCSRALVWRTTLTGITLVDGTASYALVSPIAGTEVVTILGNKMHLTTAGTDKTLEVVTGDQFQLAFPAWPDLINTGEPVAVVQHDTTTINLAPVPDGADTYTLTLNAAVRPTKASTTIEETIIFDNNSAIFHGVLYELMLMPDRPWTNEKTALIHGRHWSHALHAAKARANKGFGQADVTVQMRPWA